MKDELELLAEDKEKNLGCNIHGGLPFDILDFERISQVIQNLIENAFKFTTKKDKIYFSVKAECNNLIVSVSDTGRGISKKRQNSIFEQGTNNTSNIDSDTQRFSGLGIGLVLSRMIINLHSGRIWVESEPGKGSLFTFTIPIQYN
jgi:signal transduction histidine kinase